ncbi:MAG: hypothetical protein ACRD2W_24165 [Acidimicrobiales bacterium]
MLLLLLEMRSLGLIATLLASGPTTIPTAASVAAAMATTAALGIAPAMAASSSP